MEDEVMKEELKKAIRLTIEDLETGRKYYEWTATTSCNCGILAQNLLGLSASDLGRTADVSQVGLWGLKSMSCDLTGEPLSEIIRILFKYGLTSKDIMYLENLSNPEIAKTLGWELHYLSENRGFIYSERSDKYAVILYLKEWLKILEEESIVEQERPIPESKPSKIKFTTASEMAEKQELLFEN